MFNRIIGFAALAAGAYVLSKKMRKNQGATLTSSTRASIQVNVPVSVAYNQWTQFEEFPKFMDSVQEVKQIDDTRLHWRATIAGREEEWDAEITEQIPDKRIAWHSIGGVKNAGVVTFHRIADSTTRIMLQMDYEPQGIGEQVGDALGAVKMQTKANLMRFKQLLEAQGRESGAWRGSVAQPNTAH